MAGSPTSRLELTPDDASVLCMLCTGTATGARLVATVNLRMSSTLADVRSILRSLASGGDGGDAAVAEDPVNVNSAQAELLLAAPLHPFDFTVPFCFVCGGGNRAFAVEHEARVCVRDALPRYPRFGAPAAAAWALRPPAPTAVVRLAGPPAARVGTGGRRALRRRGAASQRKGGGPRAGTAAAAAPPFAMERRRLAPCVLYVAQGSGQEGLRLERVLAERLLLQQTAPVVAPFLTSSPGASSLLSSAAYGRGRELQQWGASVTRWSANVPDLMGRTILQEMAAAGNEVAVRYLVAQPFIHLDDADRQGNTALHLAVLANDPSCVRLLLDAGADPLRMNTLGNTPLHVGLQRRWAAIVGMLCVKLRSSGVDAATTVRALRNHDGLSPLDIFEQLSPTFAELCWDGSLLAVQSLANHYLFDKSYMTARDPGTNQTCLHAAAANERHSGVLHFLVGELRLFPAARWRELLDARLQTPLHVAVAHGSLRCAQLLIEAYPDLVSHQDINGDTPLMLALKYRRVAVAELLLAQTAPGAVGPHAYNLDGLTALHMACGLGLTRVVTALFTTHGASVRSHSSSNLTMGSSGDPGGEGEAAASAGCRQVWDSSRGDRNVTLVRARVGARLTAVALRMQAATTARRHKRATAAAPRGGGGGGGGRRVGHVESLVSCGACPRFGAGMRGYTPLLCALIYVSQRFTCGAREAEAVELLETVLRAGGLTSAEEARDLLAFLLSRGLTGLADRVVGQDLGGPHAHILEEVRRDNVLLCRLCEEGAATAGPDAQARSAVAVRWCVESRCCAGVNTAAAAAGEGDGGAGGGGALRHDGGLPLVTCARVGNAAAAVYLLECGGADPHVLPAARPAQVGLASSMASAPPPAAPPLLVAIHYGHAEVAALLIRHGARVSSDEGVWSALAAAAVQGLESVVYGLLGSDALNPYDIPHALLAVLLCRVHAARLSRWMDRTGAPAGVTGTRPSRTAVPAMPPSRRGRRAIADAVAAWRAAQVRVAEALARHLDPTATAGDGESAVHPVELLHLSACRGFLSVTHALAERLVLLAPSVMAEVVCSAPAGPTARPMRLVEPTTAVVKGGRPWRRLLPDPVTGKGGLYKPRTPFYRCELPNYHRAYVLQQALPHRVVLRDAFSYAAAAGDLELVRVLRHDVGLRPWVVLDVRGRTPADYAVESMNRELVCFFAVCGIAPGGGCGLRQIPRTLRSHLPPPDRAMRPVPWPRQPLVGPLLRAVYKSRPLHGDPAALVAAAMCSLAGEGADPQTRSEATAALLALLEEWSRQHEAGEGLRKAGAWVESVVHACVDADRLDLLERLRSDYHYPFAGNMTAGPAGAHPPLTSPLLVAVMKNNLPMLMFLLRVGYPVDVAAAPLPHRRVVCGTRPTRAGEPALTTPLCLAASMGRWEALRLLTSALTSRAPPLMAATTLPVGGSGSPDALAALVRGAGAGDDAHVAGAVRCLAVAGHPFLSPLILREAAEKRLLRTVEALVECYGPQAFLADLTDHSARAQVNSLHRFAAQPALCGLLRHLLVQTETDAYGVVSRVPTAVARAVYQLYGLAGVDGDGGGACSPVDCALRENCTEGAHILLAMGLTGTGAVPTVGRPTPLVEQTKTALRHWHRTRGAYLPRSYTVCHSAVELGQVELVAALAEAMRMLRPVSEVVLAAPATREGGEGLPAAPSLYALAARDTEVWRRCLSSLETMHSGDTALAAGDLLPIIFAGVGVTRALDAVLRMPCNDRVHLSTFSLLDPSMDAACLATVLRRGGSAGAQGRLHVDGRRRLLTGLTPLTCAIAAGSLEWVQYLVSVGPAAMVYHRAIASPLTSARARGAAAVAGLSAGARRSRAVRGGGTGGAASPSRVRHRCSIDTRDGLLRLALSTASPAPTGMDALVLAVAVLADAVTARSAARTRVHAEIVEFLLRVPDALRKENVNVVALTLAVLHEWTLLETVMDQATHLRDTPAGDRFLFPLLAEEVPPVLRRVLGAARHVMHAAARAAPRELLLRIARHSTRTDIESAHDANGRTCIYHALHHARSPAVAVEVFASLQVSMGPPCCRRYDRTPLMIAAGRGATELVARLVKAERVNQRDRLGHTPLMLAAGGGHVAVVELLLASNADASLRNRMGLTAAMCAARAGHDEVAASLAQNFSRVRDFVSPQTSLLHCAALGNCLRTAEVACAAARGLSAAGDGGGVLFRRDMSGLSALRVAHDFGSVGVLRAILSAFYASGGSAAAVWGHQAGDGAGVDARAHLLLASNGLAGGRGSGGRARASSRNGAGGAGAADEGTSKHADPSAYPTTPPEPSAGVELDDVERRILRCDASLPCFSWLRAVLGLNALVAHEVLRHTTVSVPTAACGGGGSVSLGAPSLVETAPLRPGERLLAPTLPSFRAVHTSSDHSHDKGHGSSDDNNGVVARESARVPWCGVGPRRLLSSDGRPRSGLCRRAAPLSLLRWCAMVGNVTGVRTLADANVADDCGALHLAARGGHLDCVKLLVSLNMSDANLADEGCGLLPFEAAAMAGHTGCATYLLMHTRPDLLASAVAVVPRLDGRGPPGEQRRTSSGGGHDSIVRCPHGMLHRLAPVCGGEVLVQVVERICQASTASSEPLRERVWALLQQSDEMGLTPLEYAIAMGDPRAVLRGAELLQALAGGRAAGSSGELAAAVRAVPAAVSSLSPAVRALLFDVFAVEEVSCAAGFASAARGSAALEDGPPPAAALAVGGEGVGAAVGQGRGVGRTARGPTPRRTHRLSFADVRLIGLNALMSDDYCRERVRRVFTVDHERHALRTLMRDVPFRIRYEPETFRSRPLAQQLQLLQWLSTSLVLSAYDGARPGDVETVEVSLAATRGDHLSRVNGADSGTLAHSVYVSSTGRHLVVPDVRASLTSTRQAYLRSIAKDMERLCRQATAAMHALPHPALREGVVRVEWSLDHLAASAADVHALRARWDTVVGRVKDALEHTLHTLRHTAADMLRGVAESDVAAVAAAAGRLLDPATVILRYVPADAAEPVQRFPPLATLVEGGGEVEGGAPGMRALLRFDLQTITDAAYVLDRTLLCTLAGDVALVRVHHARDRFLRRLRAALAAAARRDGRGSAGGYTAAVAASVSVAVGVPGPPTRRAPPPPPSLSDGSAALAETPVVFTLELESCSLAAMSVELFTSLLHDVASAVEGLLLLPPRARGCPAAGRPPSRFHSAGIIAEAVSRRLRAVLVLVSTRREPLVRFSGDRLMLCLTPTAAPCASDVASELRASVIAQETAVCRRLLTEIVGSLSQRLQSYLPSARLVVDLAKVDSPHEDPECRLAALRLLTYKHSRRVLEPFIEGVCIGWDGPVGACVRRAIHQLTLTLETGSYGTCYVTPTGNAVYFCPLHCIQRGARGGGDVLASWQLLSAHEVASQVLLQLAVTQPILETLVERDKSVGCWTELSRAGAGRWVVAGGPGRARIALRNLLNRRVRASVEGEGAFRFIGPFTKVRVRDQGDGKYLIQYTAPRAAGYHQLYSLLHGQQLLHSPLLIRVRPDVVALARTTLLDTYTAVVAARPFELRLRLTDHCGNRLEVAPLGFAVALAHGADPDLSLDAWAMRGPDMVVVRLTVRRAKPAAAVLLTLSCTVGSRRGAAAVSAGVATHALATAAGPVAKSESFTLSLSYVCVTAQAFARIMALRRGTALDPSDGKARENARLFFRRSIRDAEVSRWQRESEALGGAVAEYVFAPEVAKCRAGKGTVGASAAKSGADRTSRRAGE